MLEPGQSLSEADVKHRVRLLEMENQRLMLNQGKVVAESNRKVEMHLNEIRMQKEEIKKIKKENKELRDLCCFLDDDRQRSKRLSREWQRFGRYSNTVLKQEVSAYQTKLQELEKRQSDLVSENKELKQLCLYLDDQRPHTDSPRSSDSEANKPEAEQNFSKPKLVLPSVDDTQNVTNESEQLLGFIRTLEARVENLEKSPDKGEPNDNDLLVVSQNSTNSGTTYASSDGSQSPVTAVYALDDQGSCWDDTLSPIEEEDQFLLQTSQYVKPRRLCQSYSEPHDLCATEFEWSKVSVARSHSADSGFTESEVTKCTQEVRRHNLKEAVKVLRIEEKANGQCVLSCSERALIKQMCQMAWQSLDRLQITTDDNETDTELKITEV